MANYRPRKSSLTSRRMEKRRKQVRTQIAHATTTAISRRSVDAVLRDYIRCIPDMPLARLPEVVDCARNRSAVRLQKDVVQACLQRILSHENSEARAPRPEQIRALQRLIFNQRDVLLIARTGFGKSLIFHAYSIMTGKITLQIVPLTRLGDEQLVDIRHFSSAKPCLINAKTRRDEEDILRRVVRNEYTHVLLGLEQASSHAFREILKSTEFQARIGLVAIDECSFLMERERGCRPAFTLLRDLRTILHQDIVWFGCSATLDAEDEKRVLENAGFRAVGNHVRQTEVIRTSIDRPDVTLCVIPLPRSKLTSWDALFFLLQCAICDGQASPRSIPKTIVFIDERRSAYTAATWAMNELLQLSSEYSTDPSPAENCVSNVVFILTAHVAQYDRNFAYQEFCKPDSKIRIVFATTSSDMGINISDVARVVTWNIPITRSLGDLWRLLGRGSRSTGLASTAYVMLPYYLFDAEGTCRPEAHTKKHVQNQLSSDRARPRSCLSQSATPSDVSESEGELQELLATKDDNEPPNSRNSETCQQLRYWTKAEIEHRNCLPESLLRMVNSSCHRESFLMDLGEGKLALSGKQTVAKDRCCSACNPSLLPTLTSPPPRAKPLSVPQSGTHAHYLYQQICTFSVRRATALFSGEHCRFPMPPGVYMVQGCRLELAYALLGTIPEQDASAPPVTDSASFNAICTKAPLLATWNLRDTECRLLMSALPDIKKAALDDFTKHSESMRQRRKGSHQKQQQVDQQVDSES